MPDNFRRDALGHAGELAVDSVADIDPDFDHFLFGSDNAIPDARIGHAWKDGRSLQIRQRRRIGSELITRLGMEFSPDSDVGKRNQYREPGREPADRGEARSEERRVGEESRDKAATD